MLEININEEKSVNFEVQLSGIDSKALTGSIRFLLDGIEYGFPVTIQNENITAEIPALKNIVSRVIREGEKLEARLDIVGNGYYLNPWNGQFLVKSPIMVEAKIIEIESNDKPEVDVKISDPKEKSTKVIKEKKEVKKPITTKVIKEEVKKPKIDLSKVEITKEMIYNFMGKKGTTNEAIKDVLYEQATLKLGDDNKKLFKFFISYYDKSKDNKPAEN